MKRTTIYLTLALAAAIPAAAGELRAVIPVVGSVHGAFGSHFKTELQLSNRSAQPMRGTLVFHPMGNGPAVSTPYDLAPHMTLSWEDLVESLGVTGLGSLDIVTEGKGVPSIVARAYADRGEEGTTGATIPAVRLDQTIREGATATLILPSDREHFRFNVGIRALGAGATASVSIYGENGILRKALGTRTWLPNTLEQSEAEAFAGESLLANETLVFEVTAGASVVYGTTTDNTTNDPSITVSTLRHGS